jgi:hypothetical protein
MAALTGWQTVRNVDGWITLADPAGHPFDLSIPWSISACRWRRHGCVRPLTPRRRERQGPGART